MFLVFVSMAARHVRLRAVSLTSVMILMMYLSMRTRWLMGHSSCMKATVVFLHCVPSLLGWPLKVDAVRLYVKIAPGKLHSVVLDNLKCARRRSCVYGEKLPSPITAWRLFDVVKCFNVSLCRADSRHVSVAAEYSNRDHSSMRSRLIANSMARFRATVRVKLT